MTKKSYFMLLCFIFLVLIILALFSQNYSKKYTEVPNPHLTAATPKEMLIQILEREEYFRGSIEYRFLDVDKNWIEIKLVNTILGDDMNNYKEAYIYAQKDQNLWKTTSQLVYYD